MSRCWVKAGLKLQPDFTWTEAGAREAPESVSETASAGALQAG